MRTKGKTTRSIKTKTGPPPKTKAEPVPKTKTSPSTKTKVELASKPETVSDRKAESASDKKAEAVGQNNFPISYGYKLSYNPYQPNGYWGSHSNGYTPYTFFPNLGPDWRYGTYSSSTLSSGIPSYQGSTGTVQPGIDTHTPSVPQSPTVINDYTLFYGDTARPYQSCLPLNSVMNDVARDKMTETTTKSNTASASPPSTASSILPFTNTEELPEGGVAYGDLSIALVLNKIKENSEIATSSSKSHLPNMRTAFGNVSQGVASADYSVGGSVNGIMGHHISCPPSTKTIAKLHQATVEDGNDDVEVERATELLQEFSERRKSSSSAGSLGGWGVVDPEEDI